MPDARAMAEHTVESGETVAVEGRFIGKHTGPLATDDGDVAPTGTTELAEVAGGPMILTRDG